MHIALGIDTGGTYTDAVLVDQTDGTVIAKAKALTTHHDLAIGIGEAMTRVFQPEARVRGRGTDPHAGGDLGPEHVEMVGLSTTLATNAIVEGQGSPIALLLIGYDPELIRQHAFERELVTDDVVYIDGGHTISGEAQAPLDEAALRRAIEARKDKVAAFAISGYFSVRNPEHELRAKQWVERLTAQDGRGPLPVTCGHELTTKLNAIRRATTVALNAKLIPMLYDLIETVQRQLDRVGIAAPLMIVKGDGSLVRADWATRRPIETILSGPAASVVGAWHVAGREDVWVVDVGGTTTDIAILRQGQPRLNPRGAEVGGWRTMVEAADVHTVGLGGDSYVRFSTNGELSLTQRGGQRLAIGPQRVLPLARLAFEHPGIVEALQRQRSIEKRSLLPFLGEFALLRRASQAPVSATDQALLDRLHDGPVALVDLAQEAPYRTFLEERIRRLVAQQRILRAGFTPTDALHVLGIFTLWDTEAAGAGADLLARQWACSREDFARQVVTEMSNRVATALVTKVLNDEVAPPAWTQQPVAAGLLARALNAVDRTDLACSLSLRLPVVAVGAPVSAYLPATTRQLNTSLVIPDEAEVANAIGAVVGSVVERARVLIRPMDFEAYYRLHLPGTLGMEENIRDFESLDAGIAFAHEVVPPRLRTLAEQAGADHVEVQMTRVDRTGTVQGEGSDDVFLETHLVFKAVGRPASATEPRRAVPSRH
jgi:N-methylhydantoinase A/oxoprolinase/acetone carboxylase beta subunit